ncbi:MAG: hypothetical protein GY829_00250 [Gammaproteobacteria bacterium]|nr:hypothetical protein [Gammaproteobacteria bacterium]
MTIVFTSTSFIFAEETDSGLDISADHGELNLQTSIRRLEGNVLLKHLAIVINGDFAEVQPASDNNLERFIISGTPVKFEQNLGSVSLMAKTSQLIYTPSQELLEFQDNISLLQKTDASSFEISASAMQLLLKQGKPFEFDAKGSPAAFIHQLADKKVMIKAERIIWDVQNQIATLYQATVVNELTSFSADKIEYNILTGGVSATGEGEQRPSYRYDAAKDKEPLNDKQNNLDKTQ